MYPTDGDTMDIHLKCEPMRHRAFSKRRIFEGFCNRNVTSIKMKPPKKLLAAHMSKANTGENGEKSDDDEVLPAPKKNIFTSKLILEGKRKRSIPPNQEMLNKWLVANFEKSTNPDLSSSINDTYEHYVSACIAANNTVPVEGEELRKTIGEMFGSGFVVKTDSAYKGFIRKQRKTTKRSVADKAQADSVKLKMKDILQTTFTTLGNPKKGLRFRTLQLSIAANFPALKIDVRPAVLKRALERGMYSGHLECLRGIGACGYYRLNVDDEEEEEEEEEAGEDSKLENEEDAGSNDEKKDNESDKEKGPMNGSGDAGANTKQAEKGTDETVKKTEHKKKSRVKNKRRIDPRRRKVVHGTPHMIEDCFPMALVYMTEPKTTSIAKIKKYLMQHYDVTHDDKIKSAIRFGTEVGYWEHVSGSGYSGRLELTVESFNPSDDRDMCGKIMNAIVACNEPKVCSVTLIRKYILTYHPKFNIIEKPNLLKSAFQRAMHRGTVKQLSGIGATGSFQLTVAFVPSPIILAGKDNEEDYASSDDEIASDIIKEQEHYRDAYVPRPTKRHGHGRNTGVPKSAVIDPSYPVARRNAPKQRQIRRPSASKMKNKAVKSENGLPRKKSHKRAVRPKRAKSPASKDDVPEGKGTPSKRATPRKRARSPSSSEDDVSKAKGTSSKRATPRKRARSPSSSEDDVSKAKGMSSKRATPRKRARSPSSSEDDVSKAKGTSSKRATPRKRARSPSPSGSDASGPTDRIKPTPQSSHKKVEYDSAEDSLSDADNIESYIPRSTKSRSPYPSQPAATKKTPASRKTATRRNTNRKPQKDGLTPRSEDSMSDVSDIDCYTPRATKSRDSSQTPKSASHIKRMQLKRVNSHESPVDKVSSDEEMFDTPGERKTVVQPRKSAARKGGKRHR